MEGVMAKKRAATTHSRLQMEKENLEWLKEQCAESERLTSGMVEILTTFEQRLGKLEETILPVYQETGNLQRRQENIDRTLRELDHVINYYNVSKEVEAIIRDGLLGRGGETRKMGLAVKMSVCLLATLCIIIGTGGIALGVAGYPLHASCRVEWTFGLPCESVHAALRNQIEAWKTAETCGTGQKCLYKQLFSNSTTLIGTHETPVKHYIDDISYTFSPGSDGTCNVVGFSSSQLWYAVLDYGTNYCNIHNLVEGANLHVNDPKYSESTRNAVCTQYTSADCEKY